MKRVFLIPNFITAFGLSCGLFVIFKTSLASSEDLFSVLQAAAILLLIAGIADLADGAVARLIHAESDFGGQFDSLSDSVTFGVAPPLLVLKSLNATELGRFLTFIVIIASMIYALCGILRLVRFNVRNRSGNQKHFIGMPIPAAAAGLVSATLILISPVAKEYFPLSMMWRALILIAIQIVLGYFMVSRWKFPSVKALHFRVPSFYLIFATGVFAVLLLYGILDYFSIVYFLVSWIYIFIAWTLSLIRLIVGKRSATLADFEPEDESQDEEE